MVIHITVRCKKPDEEERKNANMWHIEPTHLTMRKSLRNCDTKFVHFSAHTADDEEPARLERTIERSSERPSDRATEQANDRAIERSSERSIERSSDRSIDRSSDRASDRASERSSDGSSDRASKRASERAIERVWGWVELGWVRLMRSTVRNLHVSHVSHVDDEGHGWAASMCHMWLRA